MSYYQYSKRIKLLLVQNKLATGRPQDLVDVERIGGKAT